jgi:hypothetical protein
MKTADIAMIVAAVLAFPVWIYSVRQQWSRNGSIAGMLGSGCLFSAIVLAGMFAAYLLG